MASFTFRLTGVAFGVAFLSFGGRIIFPSSSELSDNTIQLIAGIFFLRVVGKGTCFSTEGGAVLDFPDDEVRGLDFEGVIISNDC